MYLCLLLERWQLFLFPIFWRLLERKHTAVFSVVNDQNHCTRERLLSKWHKKGNHCSVSQRIDRRPISPSTRPTLTQRSWKILSKPSRQEAGVYWSVRRQSCLFKGPACFPLAFQLPMKTWAGLNLSWPPQRAMVLGHFSLRDGNWLL